MDEVSPELVDPALDSHVDPSVCVKLRVLISCGGCGEHFVATAVERNTALNNCPECDTSNAVPPEWYSKAAKSFRG